MGDRQNRVGSKIGGAGVAGASESNVDRRERLRKLALETIDLAKDPYFMRNHLGSYECKLCLTLHTNEGSYLAHTQGKKHQTNLGRRAAKDAMEKPDSMAPLTAQQQAALKSGSNAMMAPGFKRNVIKIGRPGYKVTKVRDPKTRQVGLLFEISYPEIAQDVVEPRYRFMSAYEQQIQAPNKQFQYLVIAAEPYETISFKVQSKEIDRSEENLWSHWDVDQKMFTLQFFFKNDKRLLSSSRMENAPGYYAPGTMHPQGHGDSGNGQPGTQMANPLNPFHAPMRTAA
ncbi:Splicing factor 3A subunit 2 [Podila humilis]|nr:Splicing factor 3A subunit 2 [Podila humilis]